MSELPAEDPYRSADEAGFRLVYRRGWWDAFLELGRAALVFLAAVAMFLGGLVICVNGFRGGAYAEGIAGLAILVAVYMLIAWSVSHVRDRFLGERKTLVGTVEQLRVVRAKASWHLVRIAAEDYELPRHAWQRLREGTRVRISFTPGKTIVEAWSRQDEPRDA